MTGDRSEEATLPTSEPRRQVTLTDKLDARLERRPARYSSTRGSRMAGVFGLTVAQAAATDVASSRNPITQACAREVAATRGW
jgi:hypothetical protein